MGSWGVKAHESDRGLDYLGLISDNVMKQVAYRHFDVAAAMEYLKNHIIGVIRRENRDCPEEEVQEYIDFSFPIGYSYVVTLIAECLDDYFRNGEYLLYDYVEDTERKITEFVYTADNLEMLVSELQKFFEPTHSEYESWNDSDSFDEWQAHIKRLCKSLSAIRDKMTKGTNTKNDSGVVNSTDDSDIANLENNSALEKKSDSDEMPSEQDGGVDNG